MTIDIDRLTEAELVDLNHRIAERLRFLNQMCAHARMLDFKIGNRVTLQPPGELEVTGMLTRYNKKTVTVITELGRQWNVSPHLLRKISLEPARDRGATSCPWGSAKAANGRRDRVTVSEVA